MASFGKIPQPYRLQFPLNAQQVEYIDQMFEWLFRNMRQTNEKITVVEASATTAQAVATQALLAAADRDEVIEPVVISAPQQSAIVQQAAALAMALLPDPSTDDAALIPVPSPGLPVIYGRAVAQTAAVTSVVTHTTGPDSSFEVMANVLVTTATNHNFTVTVAYTDEGGTARTMTMNFTSPTGGAFDDTITNAQGAIAYEGVVQLIRCKAGTTITIATTGTFTTVTYNVEGILRQVA